MVCVIDVSGCTRQQWKLHIRPSGGLLKCRVVFFVFNWSCSLRIYDSATYSSDVACRFVVKTRDIQLCALWSQLLKYSVWVPLFSVWLPSSARFPSEKLLTNRTSRVLIVTLPTWQLSQWSRMLFLDIRTRMESSLKARTCTKAVAPTSWRSSSSLAKNELITVAASPQEKFL